MTSVVYEESELTKYVLVRVLSLKSSNIIHCIFIRFSFSLLTLLIFYFS